MTLKEYSTLCNRTNADLGSLEQNVLHMDIGMFTELGELMDILKKKLAYKKEIDPTHLQEEVSDVLWYAVNKALFLNENIEELEEMLNVDLSDIDTEPVDIEATFQVILDCINSGFDTPLVIASMFAISQGFGLGFYKGLENNINKLMVRYPNKFSEEHALNRNLELERAELEK